MSESLSLSLEQLEIIILEQALANHKLYELRCHRRLDEAYRNLEDAQSSTDAQERKIRFLKAKLT